MKVSGLYQAYSFTSTIGIDTNSPADLEYLNKKVGDVSKFSDFGEALSFATQTDVLKDVRALYENDDDFKMIWAQRKIEIDKFQRINNII